MFQMMGVFAEFERAMIQERVAAAERGRTVTRAGSPPPPEITSDMSNRLVPCVEKVISAAEAELERADGPLTLSVLVVGKDGEEAAKARVLAEHLKLHPEDSGRPIEWTIYRVGFVKAQGADIEKPCDPEVHYTTTDGRLTLTNAEGEPIEIDGRRFSRLLGPDDDEVAVAEQLAREAHLGA
jgi:hypothetical protein